MTASNQRARVAVIIPAFNEAESLPLVLADIRRTLVDEIVVVDNGSTDDTAARAAEHGATLLHESRRGYGSACLAGVRYVLDRDFDIIIFLDADYSDHPDELSLLLQRITDDDLDLVIGSRALGEREPGAMHPHARFGNWLATRLIRLLWSVPFTDLGPFRAVTATALRRLDMRDTSYGWTVEMQAKAARLGMRVAEVPVSYRRRIGVSKISGTVIGSVKAGWKILTTIGVVYWRR